jgi:hypothetical protein
MSDRDDQLIAAAAQHAQRQALEIARDEYNSIAKTYGEQLQRGDSAGAAWSLQAIADVVNRANLIAGTAGQQQQPQPQQTPQAPQQPQLTPTQQQILERYPGIRNRWQEAQYWDRCLQAQGYDPNSDAYAHAMLIGLGVFDPSGQRESNEIASADTMVEAVRNSKYARDFTREQYDHLAQYRDELKKAGFLRVDDSQ